MSSEKSDSDTAKQRPVRRYRRRTVRIEVEYPSRDGGSVREYATTLGAGGLFIRSDRPLPRRTRLKLAFSLPGRSLLHEIEGRVVWAERPAQPGESLRHAGMGIQFTDRAAEAKLARELEGWEPTLDNDDS